MSRNLSLSFVALVVLAACSAPGAGPSSAPTSAATATAVQTPDVTGEPSAVATPVPTPVRTQAPPATLSAFASVMYDYGLTLPAGWSAVPAMLPYDGVAAIGHSSIEVDKYTGPGTQDAFSWAVPFSGNLSDLVQATIDQTVRDHSDTCPTPKPEVIAPISIGGQPGKLLGWNCGILINEAVTVHQGVAFTLILRDSALAAATNPADRALLEELLDSVVFPT